MDVDHFGCPFLHNTLGSGLPAGSQQLLDERWAVHRLPERTDLKCLCSAHFLCWVFFQKQLVWQSTHSYEKETLENNKVKSPPNNKLFVNSRNKRVFGVNQIFAGVTVWGLLSLSRSFSTRCCWISLQRRVT